MNDQERESRSVSADLPFEDVVRLVSFLPAARLRELAKGPLPELKPGDEGYATTSTCRVCVALDPMTSSGPAKTLLTWHDFVTESFELVQAMTRDDEEPATVTQVQAFIGACSYGRCCTIYALARAALAAREEPQERVILWTCSLCDRLKRMHDGDVRPMCVGPLTRSESEAEHEPTPMLAVPFFAAREELPKGFRDEDIEALRRTQERYRTSREEGDYATREEPPSSDDADFAAWCSEIPKET